MSSSRKSPAKSAASPTASRAAAKKAPAKSTQAPTSAKTARPAGRQTAGQAAPKASRTPAKDSPQAQDRAPGRAARKAEPAADRTGVQAPERPQRRLPQADPQAQSTSAAAGLDLEDLLSAVGLGAQGRPSGQHAQLPPRCGLVAIVGRPNVGKSTLINALVGQKVSITSRKAQTTRHRIVGIRTLGAAQFVFADTPGFQTKHTVRGTAALNRKLNKTVQSTLNDVAAVLWLVEAGRFDAQDAQVLALLPTDVPVLMVANKLDLVTRREVLFEWLKEMQARREFAEIVPMSARRQADVERLLGIVEPYLPQQDWWYGVDALTDRSERFMASEMIREKLFRLTGDELPYTSTVLIEAFEEEASEGRGPLMRIAATIVVEREGHKGMIIGEAGERLKRIGTEARQELERLWGKKVFLEIWVKVRSGWADDDSRLKTYGYE